MLKSLPSLAPNKGFSIDAMLKNEGVELFKSDAGFVEQRQKKMRKTQDKAIVKAEAEAENAAASASPASLEPASPVPKAKKVKKITKISDGDAALLAPVDADVVGPVVGGTKPHQDAYSGHASRLQTLDVTKCMGRRIDEDSPLAGTVKGDAGAKIKFFPEKQCSKTPKEGKLCDTCAKLDAEAKADPTKAVKRWFGRLDEPLYWHALVVGSKHFFDKYPNGLQADPTTAPIKIAGAEQVEPKAKKAPKEPKKQAKKDTPEPASEPVVEPTESVAVDAEVKECDWMILLHNGMVLIRNLKNGNVYQANNACETHEEMVMRDKFEGRWIDGNLDVHADEVDD